ncbi:MAG TPA: glycosyltransferase family 39 protein [Aliidongia sp.]|nr:glycosyltransferase family 39 protein [Aliidongia sp.]
MVAILSCLLVIFGVACRFLDLGDKFYWVDEVNTSIHAVGKTKPEIAVLLQAEAGRTLTLGFLRDLIERPDPAGSFGDTVTALVRDDPHHPPLYYLIARAWIAAEGGAPVSLRLLSALLSLLAVPAVYWLGREAFGGPLPGVICAGLFAISPFHLIYAQQVREDGLWTALVAASTAALLRAQRRDSRLDLGCYALLSILSLYTSLLSLPVLACQFCYGAWHHHDTPRRFWPLGLSVALAGLAFLPWLWIVLSQLHRIADMNSGSAEPISPALYAQTLFLNLSRPFFDIDQPSYQALPFQEPASMLILVLIPAIEIIAMAMFLGNRTRAGNLPRIMLAGAGLLGAIALDLTTGGRHALIPRYALPSWLAFQVMIAGFLSRGLGAGRPMRRWAACLCFLFLAVCGITSTATYLPRPLWWTSRPPILARAVVQAQLLDVDMVIAWPELDGVGLLSLAESLPRETKLLFLDGSGRIAASLPASLLLYDPSDAVKQSLGERYVLEELVPSSYLWIARARPG